MNFLDVRTVIFSQLVTDIVCALVIAVLWRQNRKRFAGAAWWVLDFSFQAAATWLIILRGSVPDWMSMVLANTLVIAGALAGYLGLERFVGRPSSQAHNVVILAAFVLVHSYFVFVQPSLAARNVDVSLGLLIMCFQCAWLLLRRVPPDLRQMTRGVGAVFAAFCLVSLVRIVVTLARPQPNNDFFRSGEFDALSLMGYQVLLILLAYSLALMVNRRLLVEMQSQEEKFSTAFRSSPYAITLTRLPEGEILEVNDGFAAITGYSYAEVIGKTMPDLRLWARDQDRAAVVDALSKRQSVRGAEYQFRIKSGEIITGLYSAEIMTVNGQPSVLSSISDITERKRGEEALRKSAAQLRAVLDATPFPIALVDPEDNNIEFWSQSALALFGHTAPTTPEWYRIAYPDPDYRREVIDRWKPFLEKARRTAQAVNTGEYRVTCRDGSVRVCELYAAFLADRLVVTFHDITERVRTEAARRQAEEQIKRQLEELERWQAVMLDREDRVQELKREVNALCRRAGAAARYPSQETSPANSGTEEKKS